MGNLFAQCAIRPLRSKTYSLLFLRMAAFFCWFVTIPNASRPSAAGMVANETGTFIRSRPASGICSRYLGDSAIPEGKGGYCRHPQTFRIPWKLDTTGIFKGRV